MIWVPEKCGNDKNNNDKLSWLTFSMDWLNKLLNTWNSFCCEWSLFLGCRLLDFDTNKTTAPGVDA